MDRVFGCWRTFFLDEYEKVEAACISSALDFISECDPQSLKIISLELYQFKCSLKEKDTVLQKDMEAVIRSLLRVEYWCRLEFDKAFVDVGWDYYMYAGVYCIRAINFASRLDLRTACSGRLLKR